MKVTFEQGLGLVATGLMVVSIPLSLSLSPSLPPAQQEITFESLPPCDYDDSTPTVNGESVPACAWDATKQGNGQGTSIIILRR